MKHSVCVIDDAIPAIDFPVQNIGSKPLSDVVLKYLIEEGTWPDEEVKALVNDICNDEENWDIIGFNNPSFFMNHYETHSYSPEVIIYDWDYGISPEHSKNSLLEILNSTYSIVSIFTKADKEGEISTLITTDEFSKFSDRLSVINKEDGNSVKDLLKGANNRYKENFSYRFSKEYKLNAVKAIDEILVDISQLSIADFVELFGKKKQSKCSISTHDLISILTEKFRNQLHKQDFSQEVESIKKESEATPELIRKIWSYRLYHFPADKIARKGDIIRRAGKNDDTLYLVVSSDCHMQQFWHKNYGFLALVPLHKLSENSEVIKSRFVTRNQSSLKEFKITSIAGSNNFSGITILPGIKTADGSYRDYMLNSKELFTEKISLPSSQKEASFNEKKELLLTYSYQKKYTFRDRHRVSDPFLSPLIQFIFEHVSGYGAPDFSNSLQELISESFKNANKQN